jgi:GNAT superfamily N-acetyltransferase
MTIDSQSTQTLRDGSRVVIRPIRKTDVELERRFIEDLSPESRRYRFLCGMRTPSDALLRQLTDIDERRDAALIALSGEADEQREVGAARFSATPDGRAEVAVTVSDDWRMKGLGSTLMTQLIELARDRGITALYSVDPADNDAMRRFGKALGFERAADPEDATQVIHTLRLQPRPG